MSYVKNALMCVECGDVRPSHDLKFHPHAGRIVEDGTRKGGKVCRDCAHDLDQEQAAFVGHADTTIHNEEPYRVSRGGMP